LSTSEILFTNFLTSSYEITLVLIYEFLGNVLFVNEINKHAIIFHYCQSKTNTVAACFKTVDPKLYLENLFEYKKIKKYMEEIASVIIFVWQFYSVSHNFLSKNENLLWTNHWGVKIKEKMQNLEGRSEFQLEWFEEVLRQIWFCRQNTTVLVCNTTSQGYSTKEWFQYQRVIYINIEDTEVQHTIRVPAWPFMLCKAHCSGYDTVNVPCSTHHWLSIQLIHHHCVCLCTTITRIK
jgi:hypothetical protein